MGNSGMNNASQQLEYWKALQAMQGQQQQSIAQGLMGQGLNGGLAAAMGLGLRIAPRPPIDKNKLEKLKAAQPRKIGRKVPDGITPITAWRGWKLQDMKLAALGSTGIWEPKKIMVAVCNNGGQHHAPLASCNCGMWAFKTLEYLISALEPYTVSVFGQVSLWGRIVETENGFRAQFAYPKELWLLDNALEELGYIYGVPVRTA